MKKRKKSIDFFKVICWIIIPMSIAILLVLDALQIYIFNAERLLVLGAGLIIILLPFFSEITLKDISMKRTKTKKAI